MNYLAHFHLSGGSESLIVGNFIADFVKGKQYLDYDPAISRGILLHREIDDFTDHHPLVRETKKRLYPAYRKYAAVVVDVYYDHILAAYWSRHSDQELSAFASAVYEVLTAHFQHLPPSAQFTLKYMVQHNWLVSYASLNGIEKVFQGLSRRTSFRSNMEKAVTELKRDYALIEGEFNAFLPEIEAHIEAFLKKG